MKKLVQAHGLQSTTNRVKEKEMSKQAIHELAIATQQGKLTFPQVVQGLLEAGVESYLVDFAAKRKDPLPGGWNHAYGAHDSGAWSR